MKSKFFVLFALLCFAFTFPLSAQVNDQDDSLEIATGTVQSSSDLLCTEVDPKLFPMYQPGRILTLHLPLPQATSTLENIQYPKMRVVDPYADPQPKSLDFDRPLSFSELQAKHVLKNSLLSKALDTAAANSSRYLQWDGEKWNEVDSDKFVKYNNFFPVTTADGNYNLTRKHVEPSIYDERWSKYYQYWYTIDPKAKTAATKEVDGVYNGDLCGSSSYRFGDYKVFCDKESLIFMNKEGYCYTFFLSQGNEGLIAVGDKDQFPDLVNLKEFKVEVPKNNKKPIKAIYVFK